MRQLCAAFLSFGIAAFGQTVSPALASIASDTTATPAGRGIALAQLELQRITALVQADALPRVRLDQAKQDLADAEDNLILERSLYGDLPAQSALQNDDKLIDDMIAAAERRVERQQDRVAAAEKLVNAGVSSRSALSAPEQELAVRRLTLDLAHSRARLMNQLAALAKFQQQSQEIQNATNIDYHDTFGPGMEHYEGSASFEEARDLKPLEDAFARRFARPLPISADGETDLHRALGFNHTGRVDVAINPGDPEGVWLRSYLRARNIPYYAFNRAIPGKATAAHIHIGPGSTRLHSAD